MNALLASLLILVPAPAPDEEPTGSVPGIQFVKWNKGTFEMTVTVTVAVQVPTTVVVNVNGKQEARTVNKYEFVQEIRKEALDGKGAEVYSVDGKKLDDSVWQKALSSGAIVVLTRDGKLPHPAYRKVFREGTLIVVLKPTPPMGVPGAIAVPSPNGPKR